MAYRYFSGNMYDFASPFTFSTQINQIVSNLSLFKIEHHSVNSIALDKITDIKNLVAPERCPTHIQIGTLPHVLNIAHYCTSKKYTNSLNEVSSRDPAVIASVVLWIRSDCISYQ